MVLKYLKFQSESHDEKKKKLEKVFTYKLEKYLFNWSKNNKNSKESPKNHKQIQVQLLKKSVCTCE